MVSLPSNWNYETTVAVIESIVSRLETGELELAEVFEQFEQAVGHLRDCEQFLKSKQQQMDLLVETLEDDAAF